MYKYRWNGLTFYLNADHWKNFRWAESYVERKGKRFFLHEDYSGKKDVRFASFFNLTYTEQREIIMSFLSPKKAEPTHFIQGVPQYDGSKQEEEKETTMRCEARTEAQEAKDYLIRSLDEVTWNKRNSNELRDAFGMIPAKPKNGKELKDWVAAGRLIVTDVEDNDSFEWRSPYEYLVFRGEKERDSEGYLNTLERIQKDASDVKDAIIVFGPEKGLEALNAFKAKDYTKKK